jgi:hypothetical protein
MNVNNENLNPTRSKIDWALVDSLKMADTPDDDSPELMDADLMQLQSFSSLLKTINITHFKQRTAQMRKMKQQQGDLRMAAG